LVAAAVAISHHAELHLPPKPTTTPTPYIYTTPKQRYRNKQQQQQHQHKTQYENGKGGSSKDSLGPNQILVSDGIAANEGTWFHSKSYFYATLSEKLFLVAYLFCKNKLK
jgi:hypothetical protein